MAQPRQKPSSFSTLLDIQLALLLPSSALLHVHLSPYTKVEESFNIQALHDWLFLGPWRIDEFDHITFPGAVPRSFIPSLLLSSFSYPILLILKLLGQVQTTADIQYFLRCILALLWSAALLFFIQQIVARIQIPFLIHQAHTAHVRRTIGRSLLVISACQFHMPFWAGRTTPNALAMPGVLVALALILPRGLAHERKQLTGIALLIFLAIVYRLELLGLLGASALYLVYSRISVWREDTDPHPIESIGKIAAIAQAAATASALLTLTIDTSVWRSTEWMVPEVSAMRFNVLQGKSAEWGVSPWNAYLSSLLPKLLSFATPLTVIGAFLAFAQSVTTSQGVTPLRQAIRGRFAQIDNEKAKAAVSAGSVPLLALFLLPAVHVGLLSTVAHKEWRFVAYIVPLLNTLAAVGTSVCLSPSSYRGIRSLPTPLTKILPLGPLALLVLTIVTTMVSTMASRVNYPGGIALARLHESEVRGNRLNEPHNIHLDVLPAMTGVTLLQSIHLPRSQGSPFGFLPSLLPTTSSMTQSSQWTYDKSEDLPLTEDAWSNFTHLISAWPRCQMPTIDTSIGDHAQWISGEDDSQSSPPFPRRSRTTTMWEPIPAEGLLGSSSTVEFAGIYLRKTRVPPRHPRTRQAAREDDDDHTAADDDDQADQASTGPPNLKLPLTLPFHLGSIRSFAAVVPPEDDKANDDDDDEGKGGKGGQVRVEGIVFHWGRSGSGMAVGIKTREVVWICRRRRRR